MPLGRGRREKARFLGSHGPGGCESQLRDAIPEERRAAGRDEQLHVAASPASPGRERAVLLPPREEAGPRRVGKEGGEGAEEARLLDVRAAVLGAEDVAVSAVVAGVGPVLDLLRRGL